MSGLLFIWAEPGANLSEDEMEAVYDIPTRLTIPGFLNAQRYKATDNASPSRLALYNLTSPSAVASDEFRAQFNEVTVQENAILRRFKTQNRRVYKLIYEQSAHTPPGHSITSAIPTRTFIPSPHILVVSMDISSPELDSDINNWYNNEHISDISKTKGWIRSRRYKLQSSVEVSPNNDLTPHAHQYLAIHEFDHANILTDPAFIAAGKTDKTEGYRSKVELGIRSFELHKRFN